MEKSIKLFVNPVKLPYPKIRYGDKADGGYVIVDALLSDTRALYSYGVGANVSFDMDFVNAVGCPAFQYDFSVDAPPHTHRLFKFTKRGISTQVTDNCDPIEHHLRENGHRGCNDLFLKLDVEGAEWDIFRKVSFEALAQFRQITCEFHFLSQRPEEIKMETFSRIASLFLTAHVHCNGYDGMKDGIPETLEATFIRKDIVLEPDRAPYPLPGIDFPSDAKDADPTLNWWLHP